MPVKLSVTEPLSAGTLDFGTLVPGQIANKSVEISNLAPHPVTDITVKQDVKWRAEQGTAIKHDDLDFAIEPMMLNLAAKGRSSLRGKLTVSPLLKTRGLVTGEVIISRGDVAAVTVPLTFKVIDDTPDLARFAVVPERLELKGAPGAVVEFQVRCRFTEKAQDDEVTATIGAFETASGKRLVVEAEFENAKSPLKNDGAVSFKGFLVAPAVAGVYRADVTLKTNAAGVRVIPLTLNIQ